MTAEPIILPYDKEAFDSKSYLKALHEQKQIQDYNQNDSPIEEPYPK